MFRPFERSVCVRARAAGGNERGHRRAGAPAASRAPRSRHAPAEAVHLLPPHEDHLHVHDLLRVRQVFVVEDRQVARAAGGVRVRPRRRERRHSDFRGLQNFVNRASGASGIRRIRRVLRLAAQHREADARARAARLAGHGLHAELCAGRVRARVSGFGRRTPRARRRASEEETKKRYAGGDVLAPVSGRRCFAARERRTYVRDRFRNIGCGAGRGGSVSFRTARRGVGTVEGSTRPREEAPWKRRGCRGCSSGGWARTLRLIRALREL